MCLVTIFLINYYIFYVFSYFYDYKIYPPQSTKRLGTSSRSHSDVIASRSAGIGPE